MHDIDRREISVRQDRAKGLAARGRFPALDGIRGVAVLAVMCYHFTEGYPRRYIEAGSPCWKSVRPLPRISRQSPVNAILWSSRT